MENEKYIITSSHVNKFQKVAAKSVGPGGFWRNTPELRTKNYGLATFIDRSPPNYMRLTNAFKSKGSQL